MIGNFKLLVYSTMVIISKHLRNFLDFQPEDHMICLNETLNLNRWLFFTNCSPKLKDSMM